MHGLFFSVATRVHFLKTESSEALQLMRSNMWPRLYAHLKFITYRMIVQSAEVS
jgi:hypothetical protein